MSEISTCTQCDEPTAINGFTTNCLCFNDEYPPDSVQYSMPERVTRPKIDFYEMLRDNFITERNKSYE